MSSSINKDMMKDMLKYVPSYFVPALFGFFAIPIITRLFSPAEYGKYVLIIVSAGILSTLVSSWLNSPFNRFLPKHFNDEEEQKKILSLVLKLLLLIELVFFVCCCSLYFYAVRFMTTRMQEIVFYVLIFSMVNIFCNIAKSKLRIERKIGKFSFYVIWRSISGLFFGIVLVYCFSFDIRGLLIGKLVGAVIAAVFLWYVTFKKVSFSGGKIKSELTLNMIKFGIPFTLINSANFIINSSDKYIIRFFYDNLAVGTYSASYGIAEKIMIMLVYMFFMAENPILFKKWEHENINESKIFKTKVTRYYVILGIPLTIGICLFSKPLIMILTPLSYHSAYNIMPLIAISIFVLGMFHRYNNILTLYKKSYTFMFIILLAAILNILLNILLVPRWGYMAAASTTLLSFILMLVLSVIISKRYMKWRFPWESFSRAIIAAVPMAAVILFLLKRTPSSSLISLGIMGIFSIVIYFFTLIFCGEFNEEEKRFVLGYIKNIFNK